MAEELKQEEKKQEVSKTLSMLWKVILGIVLLILAVYLLLIRGWWQDTWIMIKGCVGPFLILAALITFIIAKE